MKIQRRHFYFDNVGEKFSAYYRPRNLRHQFIYWSIRKYGWDPGMPDGSWIVKLKWHRSLIPGLRFDEA